MSTVEPYKNDIKISATVILEYFDKKMFRITVRVVRKMGRFRTRTHLALSVN